jgi:hypothetical protein
MEIFMFLCILPLVPSNTTGFTSYLFLLCWLLTFHVPSSLLYVNSKKSKNIQWNLSTWDFFLTTSTKKKLPFWIRRFLTVKKVISDSKDEACLECIRVTKGLTGILSLHKNVCDEDDDDVRWWRCHALKFFDSFLISRDLYENFLCQQMSNMNNVIFVNDIVILLWWFWCKHKSIEFNYNDK